MFKYLILMLCLWSSQLLAVGSAVVENGDNLSKMRTVIKAKVQSTHAVASGGEIQYATVFQDSLGEWNGAGTFTAKESGWYMMEVTTCWTNWPSGPGTGANFYHQLKLNGTSTTVVDVRQTAFGGDGTFDGCLNAVMLDYIQTGEGIIVQSVENVAGDPSIFDGSVKVHRVVNPSTGKF